MASNSVGGRTSSPLRIIEPGEALHIPLPARFLLHLAALDLRCRRAMLPTTVDGVVAQLRDILCQSIITGNRRDYFATLYTRVTQRVRVGILHGEFENGPRMAQLDVLFANRYLEAYDQDARGELPTTPWKLAFDATRRDGLCWPSRSSGSRDSS